MLKVVTKAAANVGGLVKLADALGIKHQSFYSWERVPAKRVLKVARLAGIDPCEVRPDIYPAPSNTGEAV